MVETKLEGKILSFDPSPNAPILEPFKPLDIRGNLTKLESVLVEEQQRDDMIYNLSGTFYVKIDLTEMGAVNHKVVRPGTVWEDVVEIEMRTTATQISTDERTAMGWVKAWRYEYLIHCLGNAPPEIVGKGTITISDE